MNSHVIGSRTSRNIVEFGKLITLALQSPADILPGSRIRGVLHVAFALLVVVAVCCVNFLLSLILLSSLLTAPVPTFLKRWFCILCMKRLMTNPPYPCVNVSSISINKFLFFFTFFSDATTPVAILSVVTTTSEGVGMAPIATVVGVGGGGEGNSSERSSIVEEDSTAATTPSNDADNNVDVIPVFIIGRSSD
jgi:hypothetical protein